MEIDIFEEIRSQFILRARLHDDEASIILKGHLLSEYLLNRIINEKISAPKKTKRITYSQKIRLLEKHCLLTEDIISNLRLLNNFRNKLAHELDASIGYDEMIFHKPNYEIILIKPKKARYPKRKYLRLLSYGVLSQLTNHMLHNLKVDPRWKNEPAG